MHVIKAKKKNTKIMSIILKFNLLIYYDFLAQLTLLIPTNIYLIHIFLIGMIKSLKVSYNIKIKIKLISSVWVKKSIYITIIVIINVCIQNINLLIKNYEQ